MARVQDPTERPLAAAVLAPDFRPKGFGWPPGEEDAAYGGTLSLHRLARCRVTVVDAATGAAPRRGNLLLVHQGNNAWKWPGMADPSTDEQESEVIPGEVRAQAACPGFRDGGARATVPESGLGGEILVAHERGADCRPTYRGGTRGATPQPHVEGR